MRDYSRFPLDTITSVTSHTRALYGLLQYIRNASYSIPETGPTGRWLSAERNLGLIYWPHLLENPRSWRKLSAVLYTPVEMERDLLQQGYLYVHTTALVDEALAWWLQHLRKRAEALLGPLQLPGNAPEATSAIHTYAALDPALHGDPALHDPDNYTIFRRISDHQEKFLQRVIVRPPLDLSEFLPHSAALPAPLVALFYAWHTLCERHVLNFDPHEIGVDFVRTGCFIVNWRRFAASPYWPRHLRQLEELDVRESTDHARRRLHQRLGLRENHTLKGGRLSSFFTDCVPAPVNVDRMLRELPKYCSVAAGLPPLDVLQIRKLFGRELPSPGFELALESSLLDFDEHSVPHNCTIVDPLVLLQQPRLFEGTWHLEQQHQQYARTRQQLKRKVETIQLGHPPTPSQVHVRVLRFRPADWLDDFVEEPLRTWLRAQRNQLGVNTVLCPWWFDNDHVEDVYAVRSRGQWTFTRPAALSDAPDCERFVWRKVLLERHLFESEHLMAAMGSDAERVAYVRQMDRTEVLQEATDQQLLAYAKASVRSAYAVTGELSTYQRRRLGKHRADAFNRETGMDGRMWYHHGVARAPEQQMPNPNDYRRIVHVVIPDGKERTSDPTIEERHFFTELAIASFEQHARSSMRALQDTEADGLPSMSDAVQAVVDSTAAVHRDEDRAYRENYPGMAPYVLAWARFCHHVLRYPELAEDGTAGPLGLWPLPGHAEIPEPACVVLGDMPAAREEDVDRHGWTPHQDHTLLTNYQQFPAMDQTTRSNLARYLGRSDETWTPRLRTLRRYLTPVFPSGYALIAGLERCLVTRTSDLRHVQHALPLDEANARRLVFSYGLARALKLHQEPGFNVRVPPLALRVVRTLPDAALLSIELPRDYTRRSWRPIVIALAQAAAKLPAKQTPASRADDADVVTDSTIN